MSGSTNVAQLTWNTSANALEILASSVPIITITTDDLDLNSSLAQNAQSFETKEAGVFAIVRNGNSIEIGATPSTTETYDLVMPTGGSAASDAALKIYTIGTASGVPYGRLGYGLFLSELADVEISDYPPPSGQMRLYRLEMDAANAPATWTNRAIGTANVYRTSGLTFGTSYTTVLWNSTGTKPTVFEVAGCLFVSGSNNEYIQTTTSGLFLFSISIGARANVTGGDENVFLRLVEDDTTELAVARTNMSDARNQTASATQVNLIKIVPMEAGKTYSIQIKSGSSSGCSLGANHSSFMVFAA